MISEAIKYVGYLIWYGGEMEGGYLTTHSYGLLQYILLFLDFIEFVLERK